MKKTICLKKNLSIIQKLWTELSFLFERKQCNEFYTDVSINLNRYFLKGKHPLHILLLETGFAVTKSCLLFLVQKGISALIFAPAGRSYRGEPSPLLNTRSLLRVSVRSYPFLFHPCVLNLGTKSSFPHLYKQVDRKSGMFPTKVVAAHQDRVSFFSKCKNGKVTMRELTQYT